MFHMRAVESPDPEARKSEVGFQAQMNTSDSCPLKVVARDEGISMLLTGSLINGEAELTGGMGEEITD